MQMRLSIVIPVYNAARTIEALAGELMAHLKQFELEILLVNDGSRDNSDEVCQRIFDHYPDTVTYVKLARNFGEHNAVMAGLAYSSGDYVVIMDDDFQNPPSEVTRLVDKAQEGNFDAVYTFYPEKKHSKFRNLGSLFNSWVATIMLHKPQDLYLSSFKCLNRFLVDEILKYRGAFPYIDGLVLSATDNIGTIRVQHDERADGVSGYTFRKLVRLWLNMFVNFSAMPLRIAFLLGLIFSLVALVLSISFIVERILSPELPAGWASLAVLMLLFSGTQLCVLGLIGEYVGRTLMNISSMPQYVVRSISREKISNGQKQT
jgi:glycosyltransferase involved in cell wall biosynthesis